MTEADSRRRQRSKDGELESGQYVRPSAVDRAHIIRLLEERRYEDVLVLLRAAHRRRPHDLEVLKSLRILELHLSAKSGAA